MRRTLCLLALAATLPFSAAAQQYVFPAKGQTPEQQKSDEKHASEGESCAEPRYPKWLASSRRSRLTTDSF